MLRRAVYLLCFSLATHPASAKPKPDATYFVLSPFADAANCIRKQLVDVQGVPAFLLNVRDLTGPHVILEVAISEDHVVRSFDIEAADRAANLLLVWSKPDEIHTDAWREGNHAAAVACGGMAVTRD